MAIHVITWVPSWSSVSRGLAVGVNTVAVEQRWELEFVDAFTPATAFVQHPPDAVIVTVNDALNGMPADGFAGRPRVGVELENPPAEWTRVEIDNYGIGVEAAQHLLQRGLSRFATYVLGNHQWSRERVRGFNDTIAAEGYQSLPWSLENSHIYSERATDPADTFNIMGWLRDLPRPVGLFAACDSWGQRITRWARRAGLRVPEDVAIVSVDNDEIMCETTWPAMSSVAIPWEQIGQEAARQVVRLLEGASAPNSPIVIPPAGVVARRSTDTLAIADPDVAKTLEIIHANADKPISVAHVLRQVPAAVNRLRRNFRKLVGRTIVEELRRVHVERARRLLATTTLPMPDVARHSGFSNATQMGIAFRAETGQTPSDYRKQFWLRT